jgi:hypothetical protein
MIEPLRRVPAYFHLGGALHCTHALTDIAGFVPTGPIRGYSAGGFTAHLLNSAR